MSSDDALLPAPARVADDGAPLHVVAGLTSPDRVAAAALGRARAAARARGLRPGDAPRRRPSFDAPAGAAGVGPRDPRPVGDTIDGLLAGLGSSSDRLGGSIQHRWTELVGAEVADNCAFESFEGGALTVRAASTAWATQLRLLVPTMLARFADDLGPDAVLEITVLGPGGPRFGRGPKRVRGRGERDTYG